MHILLILHYMYIQKTIKNICINFHLNKILHDLKVTDFNN